MWFILGISILANIFLLYVAASFKDEADYLKETVKNYREALKLGQPKYFGPFPSITMAGNTGTGIPEVTTRVGNRVL